MSAPQNPAERDSVGKALARTANPAHAASLLRRALVCLRTRGWQALWRETFYRLCLVFGKEPWQLRADVPLRKELRAQRHDALPRQPLISVVVPLYNTPPRYLKEMVASVRAQSYQNWELVLVDASDAPTGAAKLVARARDERVRYVHLAKNEGIAANTNVGLAEAEGEWITLLDHDDALSPNALYEVAKAACESGAELIYSDEVVLDSTMKHLSEYHFKPDYSPDTLRGCNYITHLCAFTAQLLRRAGGGENAQFDGAQDYDLILRLCEAAKGVCHIPKVLYYWRGHAQSTAGDISAKPYALKAGAMAVAAHLQRLGLAGEVASIPGCPGAYRTRYAVVGEPRVSVLIPNKDHAEDLRRCLASIYKYGGWRNLEVIVVENNSTERTTFALYKAARASLPGLRVVQYQGPFNFSAINNFGRKAAKGEFLLLLNNDVEVISPAWLTEMVKLCSQPGAGIVGAKLYYPDGTVQHAGVITGLGGYAGHSHKYARRASGGYMFRLATVQNFSCVTAACLLCRASVYDEVGGLDEGFTVAFNDVDFCLRVRQAGWRVLWTPYAELYHYESKSRGLDTKGPAKERFEGERRRLKQRWGEALLHDPFYNPNLTLDREDFSESDVLPKEEPA